MKPQEAIGIMKIALAVARSMKLIMTIISIVLNADRLWIGVRKND